MRMVRGSRIATAPIVLWMASWAGAGPLDPTNAPAPCMYTLEEIFGQGAEILARVQAYQAPWTLSDTTTVVEAGYYPSNDLAVVDADLTAASIRGGVVIFGVTGKVEVADTTTGNAAGSDIMQGKTAWVDGALVTGTILTRSLSPDGDAVPAGYYAATTLRAVDADLTAANIRGGVVIFGVAGKTEVADTTSGDASPADLLAGRKAWVDGAEITGSVSAGGNVTGIDGAATSTIPDALYRDGRTVTAGDTDLVTGNVRAGIDLFGVSGKTEVADTTSGDAAAGHIMTGRVAWVDGTAITGIIQNLTISDTTTVVNAGYYMATTLPAVDADLASGNIRDGVDIFGIPGTYGAGSANPAPAPVRKTGQTASYRAGDDGDLEPGAPWPSPRFVNNGDGTVTDNLTGLMWLQNASAFGFKDWNTAIDTCDGLVFADYDDWRLPSLAELESLVDFSQSQPIVPAGHPFTGVQSSYYWSGTTYAADTNRAWYVYFYSSGNVFADGKTDTWYIWPVRGGE